ncbi:MAG: iron ABC transporter permease [Angelakisella sp.]
MKTAAKFLTLLLLSLAALLLAVGLGSVAIAPAQLWGILQGDPALDTLSSILFHIRMPRALLAFVVGGALSVSGVLMQSVLRNPLASSFTLGISSGAAVGAGVAVLCGASFAGIFTMPLFGLGFGLLTVFLAVWLASKLDKNLGNTTIILTGMAFSMFANAMITFLMALSRENALRVVYWQMGSFAMKSWRELLVLFPVTLLCSLFVLRYSSEMDLMTFGEEQAQSSGVDIVRVKWTLLGVGAALTGVAVSLVGVIGFVDLFTPHVARKIFGSRHRVVLPAAALLGGIFMTLCDLLSRTLVSPIELPVGAVTAALGAPFFIYLYFNRKR